jgi:ADP-heptose:LPS heptosyltransferase
MQILFIKPKHIGDSLILTPTIVATKKAYPDSEIWVLVRRGCDGILAGCPEIDHIRTLTPVEKSARMGRDLWRDLATLFDLSNRLAITSIAKCRHWPGVVLPAVNSFPR